MMMRTEPTLRERKQEWHAWIFSTACRVSLAAAALVFAAFYVVETGAGSASGYELSDLGRRIAALEEETGSLEVKIAEYRSMESIQARVKDLNMVPVAQVMYVAPPGNAVARR